MRGSEYLKNLKNLKSWVFIFSLGVASFSFSYVDYGPVKSGDSLWKIAAAHRVHGVSTAKMVHAIQALNPSAKKLHLGSTLKIPSTLAEIQSAQSGQLIQSRGPSGQAAQPAQAAVITDKPQSANKADNKGKTAVPLSAITSSSVSTPVITSSGVSSTAIAKTQAISGSQTQTTQLLSPAVLASQSVPTAPAPAPQSSGSSSFWAWIWFFGLLIALAFGWKNRVRLFSRLQGGKEMAARRLGLHRTEHEQAFETDTLWTKEKPSYGDHPLKEGDSMAQAMIQMAEGEYLEAQKTLTEAIARDPKNIDLRMKLLENCVALSDREAFKKESDDLLENLMDEADPRWGKIKNMYLRKWAYDAG